MIDKLSALKIKTELLCKGLYLEEKLIDHYQKQGINIGFGRKGGAGPLGGRYFILEDNKTLVNTALWNDPKRTDLILKKKKGDFFEIYNSKLKEAYCKLKLVEEPVYYSPEYKTSDGIPMKMIALVHGIDCLATTVYQKCKYWSCGEACKFCGIELSLNYKTTIESKSFIQINEVIDAAKREGRCNHITLTSGTEESKDKGTKRYIEILKGIKTKYPDLPLHIQIEPFEEDLLYINQLYDAGADTIGIHIEVIDDDLRKIITPGKFKITYDTFRRNWKYAVDVFGKNQVETFVLMGLGESQKKMLEKIEDIISMNVIPFITPVRAIPNIKSKFEVMDYKLLYDFYLKITRLMKKYDLNPLKNKAGCVRCGGCSAINEAFNAT